MSTLSTKPRRKEKNLSFFFLKAFVIKYKVEDGGWCSKDVRESYGKPLERIEIFWLVELPSRLGMCEGLDFRWTNGVVMSHCVIPFPFSFCYCCF